MTAVGWPLTTVCASRVRNWALRNSNHSFAKDSADPNSSTCARRVKSAEWANWREDECGISHWQMLTLKSIGNSPARNSEKLIGMLEVDRNLR
jgi:hypothetical protein